MRAQKLDGDIAESFVRFIASDMSEGTAGEVYFAVGELEVDLGLAEDGVDDISGTQYDVKIVNIVLVQERGGVRGDRNVEDANVLVFEGEMMAGLA